MFHVLSGNKRTDKLHRATRTAVHGLFISKQTVVLWQSSQYRTCKGLS